MTLKDSTLLRLETNKDVLPGEGTPVKLIIEVASPLPAEAPGEEYRFAPLAAGVTAPLACPLAALVPAPVPSLLPPVEMPQGPRLPPSRLGVPDRPVAGPPPPAWQADPPPPPRLPALPPARVGSPDPACPPLLWGGARYRPGRPSPTSDPVLDLSRQAALAARPPLRESPAPFLRLTIPDPFESVAAVRLREPPPDDDPPASAVELPPGPVLPAKP
jgi:hypothetical protein